MSRDFEKEYRELAESQCPDLWDRIEARLTERPAPEKRKPESGFQVWVQKDICQEEKSRGKKAQVQRERPGKGSGGKGRKRPALGVYAGVAAAAACAFIIIPAFVNLTSPKGASGGTSTEGSMEGCDTAAPESVALEEAGGETAAAPYRQQEPETAAGDRRTESPAAAAGGADMEDKADLKGTPVQEKGAGMENAPVSGITEGAASAQQPGEEKEHAQDKLQESGGNAETATEKRGDVKEEGKEDQGSSQAAGEEKAVLSDGMAFHVVVEVMQAREAYRNETPAGTLYTVAIQDDEDGFFKEGQQMEIFAPLYSSQALAVGEVFEVDIVYRQEEAYPYVLRQGLPKD